MRTTYQAAVSKHGTQAAAARAMGISRLTFRSRLMAEKSGMAKETEADVKEATLPEFPNPDLPTKRLIELRREQFIKTKVRKDAEKWFPVHIQDGKPIGILWFGDPHLDDDGCNWPLLERHVMHTLTAKGLYAANIGDTTNNWAGRLVKLYANQDTSKKTARRFAKWFLAEAGIPWLVWLMGNHDAWDGGSDYLRAMNVHKRLPMLDGHAKFEVIFKGKQKIKVHAAHDFPGHSMWNGTHGMVRAAQMTTDAELLVCGHRHFAATQQFVNGRGNWVSVARCRGYKFHDEYAESLGYMDGPEDGAAVLTILDPTATGAGRVLTFPDVDQGVRVLKALRGGK